MKFKAVAATILILLLLILGFQNKDSVTVQILFWEIRTTKIVLLPAVALAGFLLGILLKMRTSIKKSRRERKTVEKSPEQPDPKITS